MSKTKRDWLTKRLVLIVFFLFVTPVTLTLTVFSLLTLTRSEASNEETTRTFFTPETRSFILAPLDLPPDIGFTEEIIAGDSREELLRQYLKKHKSPLLGLENYIVETSDKYSIDYRLLVAIAQKESGLCRVIPEGSHNCWGWGIHSRGTLKFDSYEVAIETVAKGLKTNYVDKGYITVEQIMEKYAHPSSTTWAEGVINYMNDIQ